MADCRIINGDCLKFLQKTSFIRTIFVDVPDNIDFKYKDDKGNVVYNDNLDDKTYYGWIDKIIKASLDKCDIFWMSFNQKHDLGVKDIIRTYLTKDWIYKQIIWTYTFGQYNDKFFSSSYRPIILLLRKGVNLNLDTIREPSKRMQLGDKRAVGPRVPSDIWSFPRIVGNSKERRKWFPTQHPIELAKRIVKCSISNSNEVFVDLCLGSGTSAIVCKELNINFIGIEQSEYYCSKVCDLLNINYEKT